MSDLEGMEEVLQEFLVESSEGLDQFDRDMVDLEQAPSSPELIASAFRTIHTIKGTSGFLGFTQLESVAHVGENLLSLLRDEQIKLNAEIITALLRMGDAVRRILEHVEADGSEGPDEDSDLRAELSRLADPDATTGSDSAASDQQEATGSTPDEPAQPTTDDNGSSQKAHATESSIRVGVSLLDSLMNLVGELVLARNQVIQYTASLDDSGFATTSQRLNLITTELQEGVMKTRMQPIGNVWSKFPRVVRDLAVACGKKVAIEMEGRDTDLDRTIIEAIRDPLTHVIRNAVDHGIESPADREAAGKPAEGTIQLRAFHEGGQVNIEINDDGGGINAEKVKQKAIDRGLITPEAAATLSERECVNLIFSPGFSTAEQVTNVSGRGVGMDVVRTNIEKIGGVVDLKSRQGKGTQIRIKIPLTLAIIPALIVRSDGNSYAIPQVSLLELVRLDGKEARSGIESIHGAPVYRLRGNLLPLAYLAHELGQQDEDSEHDEINIVVLQADDRTFGLVVEEILDTEEIVVKPLGKQLKGLGTFAGTTIMGDGSVALILDVLGLAQQASIISESENSGLTHEQDATTAAEESRQTVLLIGVGDDGRAAIQLSIVARLEEFSTDSIELASGSEVVQYRGDIMPLVRLSDALGYPASADDESLQVVVHTADGRNVGLVVDTILDVVEEELSIKKTAPRNGVLGAAVLQGKVTDVLDLDGIIESQLPGLINAGAES